MVVGARVNSVDQILIFVVYYLEPRLDSCSQVSLSLSTDVLQLSEGGALAYNEILCTVVLLQEPGCIQLSSINAP